MKLFSLLAFIFAFASLHSQDFSVENLQAMGDEEILTIFNEVTEDSIMAETVARVYLDRARRENDTIKMARGYDRLARIFHPEKNIMFADSVIELTKELENKSYPALGYIIKSYEYSRQGNLILETENALIGYELAVRNENISQQIYLSDFLIYNKSIWGNKREALTLQKERHELMYRHDYFNKIKASTRRGIKSDYYNIHLKNELSSIQNFVFCYLKLMELDSARIYHDRGVQKLQNYEGPNKIDLSEWFLECSVEIDYYSGNYLSTIKKANALLFDTIKKLTPSSRINLNFFKGLSFTKLKEYEIGIKYLYSADSIFENESVSIQPYHRELFEILLSYYNTKDDSNKKIEYLNKLLSVDSIFKINYRYFEPDLIKNFETPKLLKEKEELIADLKIINKKSTIRLWWGLGLLLVSLTGLVYYFSMQLLYKRRFENLIAQREFQVAESDNEGVKLQEISATIVESILDNLDEFEANNHFLSQKISLQELATRFGTNPRYLSKVINLQKDKNFSTYINDLRVDYALKELTENRRFRKFTIKAIAFDCGFKSAESFSKGFYKRHGIYPSYYIKKIESMTDQK